MTRREALRRAGLAGMGAALSGLTTISGCGRFAAARGGNIILIVVDTLRADHLGCYGYDKPTSPTIDKLAADAVILEDVSAPSPWTLPSHASMFTGLYPSRLGLNDQLRPLPKDVPVLASILSKNGFTCAAVVNSLYLDRKFAFDKGFDDFTYVQENNTSNGDAPKIIDLATKWLERNRNKRFFLFLHIFDVHSDYNPLQKYKQQFTTPYSGAVTGSTEQLMAFRQGTFRLDSQDLRHLIGLYDGQIRQTDDELKRFFSFIDEQGLFNDSTVIITSDHGEEFLEHGGVLHGRTQYQELLRVPFIVRLPGAAGGKRLQEVVSLVDVMPTICGLAGVKTEAAVEGLDVSPLIRGSGAKLPQRFIFAEADHNNAKDDIKRMVRFERHKLHHDRLVGSFELYDLSDDPAEKKDTAAAQAGIVTSLREELDKFTAAGRTGTKTVPLSDEELRRLKSLGYL